MSQGFTIQTRRSNPSVLLEKSRFVCGETDVLCRATESLTGATAGSDAVIIDWANFIEGQFPPVKKSTGANQPIAGVVHWGEGTVSSGDTVWVRVKGRHGYAKVDGSGTAVAAGDMLATAAAAGKLVKTTTTGNRTATATEAETTDGAASVYLGDPEGLLAQ